MRQTVFMADEAKQPVETLDPGLYVVATPIGNRSDLSSRAAAVLHACDRIACEDTRHTRRITDQLGIQTPLVAYHEHNERTAATQLADAIAAGESVALVSDAGTPAISDPGFRLVRECRVRGLNVFSIPGPSAVTAALSVSGLPSDGFLFLGFLPPKSAARRRVLERFRDLEFTLVFYESTHRILKFVENIIEVMGPGRTICVAKELTKLHETVHTGTAQEVKERLEAGSTKGEFVVLVAKEGYSIHTGS